MMSNTSRRESTRTVILALLLSRKGGCTLTQLDNDYRELEGERIPWKEFGCVSLLNFLQSIPQTVQIECRGSDFIVKGIPSNKSKHVSTLVTEQKNQCKKPPIGRKYFKPIYPNYYYPKPSMPRYYPLSVEWLARIVNIVNEYPDGVNKDYVFNMVSSCLSHVNISAADMDYQLQQLSHKLFVADNKIYPIESRAKYLAEQNKSMDFQKKGEQLESQYGVSHSNDKKWETSVITISGDEDQNDLLDGYDGDECYAVPSGYTPHYSSADINTKSTNNFNDSVSKCPYQTSTNEAAMQGTNVQIKQNHLYDTNNINNICVPSNEREMHNVEEQKTHYFNTKDTETLINDRLKFRLEKLIQNHPDGIWCADLPDKYLEEYKVSLNYLELGFSSVRDFTAHLPEIFHCIQLDPMGDFMLYYAKNEIPSNKKRQRKKSLNLAELHEIYMHDDEIEALPLSVSMDICKELIPDDVMTIGETVGYLSVTELAQEDTLYHEVIVVEVFTPSFFWIQLRKKQLAFKKFMSDLDNFYAKQSNQYKIPTVVLEKGLNCACKYGGIWHRAIIKTVRPDLQVTVLFYDYGTLKTYPFEAIHYLHRKFSHPPAQAIPCGLVNTRPCNDSKWSHHATQEFGLRAMKGPLCAVIASTNPEDNSMMVTLTDTINDDDLHINDWMVEQKLAEHGKMEDHVDMSKLMLYVEEDLLNADECYSKEVVSSKDNKANESTEVVPSKDNKANELTEAVPSNDNSIVLTEESLNVPLISPESTLADKSLKVPPGLTVTPEALNLQKFLEENDRRGTSSDLPEVQELPKLSTLNSTNPFLQDVPTPNLGQSDLSPQKLLDLWQENLRVQMQITAAFETLVNKMMENTMKSKGNHKLENGTMANVEQQMNSIAEKSALGDISTPLKNNAFHANKQICDITPLMHIDSPFLYQDDTNRTSDYYTPDRDIAKLKYSNNKTLFPAVDYQQVNAHIVPPRENVYYDSYPNLSQSVGDRNIARDRNANSVVQTSKNYDIANQFFLVNGQIPRNENVLQMEPAKAEDTAYSNYQNDFPNKAENDEVYKRNTNVFKETNPFRLSMAGKLRLTDSPNDSPTHTIKKPISEHNLSFDDFYMHKAKVKGLIDVPLKTDCSYKDSSAISEEKTKGTGSDYFISKNLYTNASMNESLAVSNNDYVFTDYEYYSVNSEASKVNVEPFPGICNMKKGSEIESLGDLNIAKAELSNHSIDTEKKFNSPRTPFSCKSIKLGDDPFGIFPSKKQENDSTFKSLASSPRSPAFPDHHIENYIEKIWRQPDYNCRNSSDYSNSFFTSDENCNGDVVCNNVQTTSNYLNSNIYGSSWFPINSFPSPLLTDYANIDEGYITRSSTSQTLDNPLTLELNCDTDNNLQLFGKNLDLENNLLQFGKKLDVEDKLQSFGKKLECSVSAETWMRSVEKTINSQCPASKQVSSTRTEPPGVPLTGKSFINFDELTDETRIKLSMRNFNEETSQDNCYRRHSFKDADLGVPRTEECNSKELVSFHQESFAHQRSLASILFVQTVELPKRTIHLFHYRDDGWLLMDEFVEAFTALKTSSTMINLLHTLDVHLQIQEIKRTEYPLEFARLDREFPSVMVIKGDKRNNISLIPLKSTLRILCRLGIISSRDVDDAIRGRNSQNNATVHEIWIIINAYGKFKRFLGNDH